MGKIYLKNKKQLKNLNLAGFTIVELLVVIVVIGILAAISVVSYNGITQRAKIVTLQSDLTNAKTTLSLYQAEHGSYPTNIDMTTGCPTGPIEDTKYCLKASSGNTFTNYFSLSGVTFSIVETNTDGTGYTVTDNTSPVVYVAPSSSTFSYTGDFQTWVVPSNGSYKLEVWGAQGGTYTEAGGKGGYSMGTYNLTAGQVIYVYVGGAGGVSAAGSLVAGGFNGGGQARSSRITTSGGGGTDIRVGGQALSNRVIVAGGGGGGRDAGEQTNLSSVSGAGGGISGNGGSNYSDATLGTARGGRGGTQSAGGASGLRENSETLYEGGLGFGGYTSSSSTWGVGGGGGYYGGGPGSADASGGGGSGYIDGVTGGMMLVGVQTGNGSAKITKQ